MLVANGRKDLVEWEKSLFIGWSLICYCSNAIAIAGTEALFADLGHFTYGSIQVNNIFVLLMCDYLRVCWISMNLEGFY